MKSGFVALIGRPNVGKSTLMNQIIGSKIAIISDKPQTTRNTIKGIYNSKDTQIVFVDTPGIHKPRHNLGKYLNRQAYYTINDVDLVILLVDGKLGKGDKYIIEQLKNITKPVILVINKIDLLTKEEIMKKILEYKDLYDFKEIVPVSSLKNTNIDTLIKVIRNYLKDDVKYYEDDDITDKSLEFIVSELVREKIFNLTKDEIPHSTTCVIEQFKKKKNGYLINVAIIVDRPSIKKIIVGAHGSMIKQIGIKARYDIEKLLNEKVYLDLFVKVIPKWRDKERYLSEFGYKDFE